MVIFNNRIEISDCPQNKKHRKNSNNIKQSVPGGAQTLAWGSRTRYLQHNTGVVDPKRRVVQSVSGMVTHTSTCHVYRMGVCQMYAT